MIVLIKVSMSCYASFLPTKKQSLCLNLILSCQIMYSAEIQLAQKGHLYQQAAHLGTESLQNETNLQDLHVEPHDPQDTKCRKLMQINENVKYNLALAEHQLDHLKKKQIEKNSDNKKLKEKLRQKREKQGQLRRHIQLQKEKITKLLKGYQLMQEQLQQMKKKQCQARELRINSQDRKNKVYEQYQAVEQEYRKFIYDLKQLEGIEGNLEEAERQNEDLQVRLEEIQQFLDHKGDLYDHYQERRNTISQVKDLNEKVYEVEKQGAKLLRQIDRIQKQHKSRNQERMMAEERAAEVGRLSRKIEQLQTNVAQKRAEFAQLDSTYKQLCIQESKMKKQLIIERECLEEQRRYKLSRKKQTAAKEKRQQISNSHEPNEEQLASGGGQGNEISQIELMSIIQRYQNIKSRS